MKYKRKHLRFFLVLIVLALAVAFKACAGDGGTSSSVPNPAAEPAPGPAPGATPNPAPPNPASPAAGTEAVLVANRFSSSISGFTIDAQTGALKPMAGSPFALAASPTNLSLSPSGDFVFATTTTPPLYSVQNPIDLKAVSLRLDRRTGALKPANSTQLSRVPLQQVVAPSGRFLYAATNGSVLALSIDPATGAMTEIAGSPFQMQAGTSSLAINPGGAFAAGSLLYSTSGLPPPDAGSIQGALVDPAGGAVSSPFPAAVGPLSALRPSGLAFHPSGNFVVAAYSTNQVASFSIDARGKLTQIGAPVATGAAPFAVAFEPAGRFLLVVNAGSNTLSVYSFDSASGVLTPAGAPVRTGAAPIAVAVTASGGFVFTANQVDSTISEFRLESSGTLTLLGHFPVGNAPVDVMTIHF